MRILLLEDEEAIRGFVRINLKRNGMEVTEAEDGETALALAEAASPPFDVALLDVMLPTISGFEVCEQLRARFPRMGIIMLTAKSQEEDKIRGLELGADDYVQKPFSPGELIARLNSLNRRMMPGGLSSQAEGTQEVGVKSSQTQASDGHTAGLRDAAETVNDNSNISDSSDDSVSRGMNTFGNEAITAAGGSAQAHLAFSMVPNASPLSALPRELCSGPFRLSAAERRLWKQGAEIVLTPTEWTLVELLMKRAGEGLSRDAILDAVWGRHFIGDLKIVDVNIRRIRQKLEDEPSEPQYIETLWGFGYRWKRSEAT